MDTGIRTTFIGIFANTFLFIIKMLAAVASGSLILFSEALNSFTDVIYSVAIYVSVRVSGKKPDKEHPFGHHRAQPIAALIVSILAAILGIEVIIGGIERSLSSFIPQIGLYSGVVLVITIAVKLGMSRSFLRIAKRIKSPAIMASAMDSRNDVKISLASVFGITATSLGYPVFDIVIGIVIGMWLLKTSYDIGLENINYLMGHAPSPEMVKDIRKRARNIAGVKGTNDIRAHYVGNFIHVEVHIEVDEDMVTKDSHDVGKAVERNLESISAIDKAFVHIDPV